MTSTNTSAMASANRTSLGRPVAGGSSTAPCRGSGSGSVRTSRPSWTGSHGRSTRDTVAARCRPLLAGCPSTILATSPTTTRNGACRPTTSGDLFEMLTLEGAQAGLSWRTILDKREGYRRAFAGFDADEGGAVHAGEDRAAARRPVDRAEPPEGRVHRGQRQGDRRARRLLRRAPLVVRRRRADRQSLAAARRRSPPRRRRREAMSKELKRRGFRFVGPTVCYAFMQADGHGQRPRNRLFPVVRGPGVLLMPSAVAPAPSGGHSPTAFSERQQQPGTSELLWQEGTIRPTARPSPRMRGSSSAPSGQGRSSRPRTRRPVGASWRPSWSTVSSLRRVQAL